MLLTWDPLPKSARFKQDSNQTTNKQKNNKPIPIVIIIFII